MVAFQVSGCKGFWTRRSAARRFVARIASILAIHLSLDSAATSSGVVQDVDRSGPATAHQGLGDARVARMKALLRVPGAVLAPDELAQWVHDLDRRIRRLALMAASRGAVRVADDALMHGFGTASAADLRAIVDQAIPPLPDAWATTALGLFPGATRDRGPLLVELVARGGRGTAERGLRTVVLRGGPAASESLPAALAGLADAGTVDAAGEIARLISHPDPAVSSAARDALDALRSRLLSSARAEDALRVIHEGRAVVPRDLELIQHDALTTGVYLDRAGAAYLLLRQEIDRRAARRDPATARESAELLLGVAIVALFAGEVQPALAWLAEASAAVGQPPRNQREAAITAARVLVVTAIVETFAGAPAKRVVRRLTDAIDRAPYEAGYCVFDEALSGVFGPQTVLEVLRRRGHDDVRLAFFDRLDEALRFAIDASLAIPAEGADALVPASDAAVLDAERVKSWSPCWQSWALYQAGRLDEAAARALRTSTHVRTSNLWNNRLLAAECDLLRGHVESRRGDADAAEAAYTSALVLYEEVGEEQVRQRIEETDGRFVAGSPPLANAHRSSMAKAHLGLADVHELFHRQEARAREESARALELAPDSTRVVLHHARFLLPDVDPERARRSFDDAPRTADLLLELSRLAARLGEKDDAERLFRLHLDWNALAPTRRVIEEEWHARESAP